MYGLNTIPGFEIYTYLPLISLLFVDLTRPFDDA